MTLTANDLLMGGGGKSASFPEVGAAITGRITAEPQVKQQTEFGSDNLKFFPNGDPMMQIVIAIQTSDRDPEDSEDDGIRQLYVKSNMLKAVKEAVVATGAKGLETGGTLTVTYHSDGEPSKKGFNPPKLYRASYTAPSAQAANNLLMGAPKPDLSNAWASSSAPTGIDPAVWAALGAEQKKAFMAASSVSSSAPPF